MSVFQWRHRCSQAKPNCFWIRKASRQILRVGPDAGLVALRFLGVMQDQGGGSIRIIGARGKVAQFRRFGPGKEVGGKIGQPEIEREAAQVSPKASPFVYLLDGLSRSRDGIATLLRKQNHLMELFVERDLVCFFWIRLPQDIRETKAVQVFIVGGQKLGGWFERGLRHNPDQYALRTQFISSAVQ